jgi:glycosyltransferase involved in cell wall biosynthesis
VYDQQYVHIAPGYFLDLVRSAPEAIITNEMGFRTLLALLYGTLWRKPVWVWWGGTQHTEQKIGRLRRLFRSVIARWAKHWISYGATSTEYLTSLGIPRSRVVQIQNCVDERRFAAPAPAALDLRPRPVLLHVGQFVGRKGISQFLRCAAELQREGLVFSIVLVGSGPNRERVQQLVGELGLSHVNFLPPQPPAAMPGIYRSANCLVFPTLEDVWGLVVNEALWAGLPVIGSVYAGCAKELLPAEALFDPLDPAEFKAALRRAILGQIPPPDLRRLKTKDEVAALIVEDLRRVLNRQSTPTQGPT